MFKYKIEIYTRIFGFITEDKINVIGNKKKMK